MIKHQQHSFAGNVFANYKYTRTDPSTPRRDGPLASVWAERLEVKPKLLTTEDTTDALPFCLFSFLWLLHSFFLPLSRVDLHLPSYLLSPNTPSPLTENSHRPPTVSDKGGGRKESSPAHGNFLRRQAQRKNWTQISWEWQNSRDCILMLQLLHTLVVICSHKKICQ